MQPILTPVRHGAINSLLMTVGLLLAAAGCLGYFSDRLPEASLTSLVVTTPTSGMVATAQGSGGVMPTQVDPATSGLIAIRTLGFVPTTPVEFLRPRPKTLNGVADGSSPALWKVWWDGQSQTETAVSLQQSLKASDAEQGMTELNQTLRTQHPDASTVTIPGVSGAFGYTWEGATVIGNGHVSYQVWAAMFCRSTEIALVSMNAYGAAKVDPVRFYAFASAEYAAMRGAGPSILLRALFGVLAILGVAMLLIGFARHRKTAVMLPPAIVTWQPLGLNGNPSSTGGRQSWGSAPAQVPSQGPYAVSSESDPAAPRVALPPPDWYPDPQMQDGHGGLRCWSGTASTASAVRGPTASAVRGPTDISQP